MEHRDLDDDIEDDQDLFGSEEFDEDLTGPAYDESDQSDRHHDCPAGDCDDYRCACQNRMCHRSARDAARRVRTKRVDGKDLPASKFAFVGDPSRTETWKLPIHDAGHVRDALSRFDQTEGIPASEKKLVFGRILAAAKKFGVAVSDQKSASLDFERRVAGAELRAAGGSGDADPLRLTGYAAVFGTYATLPGFREKVNPAAFNNVLAQNPDTRCLFNHDVNQVLGRTTNKTLRLSVDSKGLRYTCYLPNTQAARDLHTSISRGDINQCSFSFNITPDGQKWTEEKDENGVSSLCRELMNIHSLLVS